MKKKRRINSCEKGKVGEREFAAVLRGLGFEARRGRQFSGSPDSPDVVTSVEGIHFEVKRTEKLQLFGALKQAEHDAGASIPVVAHRKNRTPWVLILKMEDIPEFIKRYNNAVTALPSGSSRLDLQIPANDLPESLCGTTDRIGEDAGSCNDL